MSGRGGAHFCRRGCNCGRHPPYPWHALTEAALAYAAAESETEFRRATSRLISAARRYRDDRRPQGRPFSRSITSQVNRNAGED